MQLREYSCEIEEKEGKILSLENRLNECQQQKNDECDTMKMKICKLTNQFEETHGMNVSLSKQMDSLRDQIKQVTEEKCKLMDQVKDRDQGNSCFIFIRLFLTCMTIIQRILDVINY